jgi:hypothetical protein
MMPKGKLSPEGDVIAAYGAAISLFKPIQTTSIQMSIP